MKTSKVRIFHTMWMYLKASSSLHQSRIWISPGLTQMFFWGVGSSHRSRLPRYLFRKTCLASTGDWEPPNAICDLVPTCVCQSTPSLGLPVSDWAWQEWRKIVQSSPTQAFLSERDWLSAWLKLKTALYSEALPYSWFVKALSAFSCSFPP